MAITDLREYVGEALTVIVTVVANVGGRCLELDRELATWWKASRAKRIGRRITQPMRNYRAWRKRG